MMTFLLSQRAHPIGKVQSLSKIAEAESPFEPSYPVDFHKRPLRDFGFSALTSASVTRGESRRQAVHFSFVKVAIGTC